ncbi:MAG: NmrA family NAD(P)-binding protein, partial [Oryzihumus sp.]
TRCVLGGVAAVKTGRAFSGPLAARAVSVRAGGPTEAPAPQVLRAGAAEVAVADLATGEGLEAAVSGVDAVYHLAPNMHPDEVGIARRVATAAVAAGVTRLVLHSVLHPHDRSMPHHLRKADAEEVVRAVVPSWTVLQPAAYLQNLLPAARQGSLAVPYSPDSPFTFVDLEDVAQVAATVLTRPGHERATYELAGDLTSVRGLAAEASGVLGHPVQAVGTDPAGWAAGPGRDLPGQAREDLLAMFAAYDRRGLAGNAGVLTHLLGRRPTTWAELLRREG